MREGEAIPLHLLEDPQISLKERPWGSVRCPTEAAVERGEWRHPAPSPGTTHSISAATPELWTVWASVFYLHLFCASWQDVSLGIRKEQGGYFLVWECSKHFPYEWMVIAFLLYLILAYRYFCRNALLSDGGGPCTGEAECPWVPGQYPGRWMEKEQ